MQFIQQIYNGVAQSAIYLAIALGITLVYGLTRLINFAQGQLLVLSSFLTYQLVTDHVPIWAAIIVATLATALIGELLDLALFRRTLHNPLVGFVISLGLITVLQEITVLVWSPNDFSVAPPFAGVWHAGSIVFDQPRLLLIASVIVMVGILFGILELTKVGRGIRALAENATTAQLMGIPVRRYVSITFMIGSALAGVAGALLATIYPFNAFSGTQLVLVGFAVAIVGGLGSVFGAAVAALLLTLPQTLASAYLSQSWAPAFGLLATIAVILWRPSGLFRTAGSAGASHFSLGDAATRLHAYEVRLATHLKQTAGAVPRRWRYLNAQRGATGIGVILIALAPVILVSATALSTATYMLILAVAAVAFWFAFRQAGIFPMTSGAFMGVGGYTAAVTLNHLSLNFWLELPLATVAAGVVAFVVGLISLRASASYFVILTLVIAELIVLLFTNLTSWTNGQLGITDVVPPSPIGPLGFSTPTSFYYLCFVLLAVATACVYLICRTRFGQRLITVRENERLARSLGINAFRDKIVTFTISGAICGAAGVLLFYYLRYVSPSTFDIPLAIDIQLIVLLGGATVWSGPFIGAALFAFLPEILNLSASQEQLAYGLTLIVVILLMPSGIGGLIKRSYLRLRLLQAGDPVRRPTRPPDGRSGTIAALVSRAAGGKEAA
jgi:branched-subunit amino acid ABC-type transport system permease component